MSKKRTPEQLERKRELYKKMIENVTPERKEELRVLGKIRYERRKEKATIESRNWQKRNPERHLENKKNYKEKSSEKIKEYEKKRWIRIKDDRRIQHVERYKSDINYNITKRLRSRLSQALRAASTKKTITTNELLGIPIQEFIIYLESKFLEGMTWENRSEWHIDHIRPCASFNLSKEEQQRECFYYKNLQPLWKLDNSKKSSKYNGIIHTHKKSKL